VAEFHQPNGTSGQPHHVFSTKVSLLHDVPEQNGDTSGSGSIGVVVITHRAKRHLPRCLPPLIDSPLKPRVLVVNSSSNDGTVEEAERLGAETLVIPRQDFNHGQTRERARRHLDTDFVCMVTPDAYAEDERVLGTLLEPVRTGRAAVSYARQIPHEGASFLEAFPRGFNYPTSSEIRSIEDAKRYGIYTIFCSNAFAAYRNSALDEIGGFRSVLTHEDQFAVAELLRHGHRVAYVAEAVVNHSHAYKLRDEFRRYFDAGYTRSLHAHLTRAIGSDHGHGTTFTRALIKRIVAERPLLLPYAMLNTGMKWVGYQLGANSKRAPNWLKKMCSGQDYYWSSTPYKDGPSS